MSSGTIFVAFVEDKATMNSVGYFESHVSYLCKTDEVDPIKLNFCMTNKCFDSIQIYVYN